MKLPLPNRGQPFDLALVYRIIEEINNLWTEISVRISSYSTVQAGETLSSVRSSELRTFAAFKDVINNDNVKASEPKTFEFTFDRAFKSPPIVSTSVQAIGDSNASDATKSSTIVLTKVESGKVEGFIKFEKAGRAAVRVNIIAVGIPA